MDKRALRISQKEESYIRELFKHAIVIFDSSAILDMYTYPIETRQILFDRILKTKKFKLWIPGQVEFEYLKNKDKVISKPINDYNNLIAKTKNHKDGGYVNRILETSKAIQDQQIKKISGILQTLTEITKTSDKHPYLPSDIISSIDDDIANFIGHTSKFIDDVENFRIRLKKEVSEHIHSVTAIKESDDVLRFVMENFTIGPKYSFSRLFELYKEGKERYSLEIPPGYLDSDKTGIHQFGDYILWFQILEYSKSNSKSVIFVTNDTKEDWWDKDKNSLTPRIELIKEFVDYTAQDFWMFTANEFYYSAKRYLNLDINDKVLDQIPEVKLQPILKRVKGREGSFTMWLHYKTNLKDIKVNDTYLDQSFDITASDIKNQKVLLIAKFARQYHERGVVSNINATLNTYNNLRNRIHERTSLILAYTFATVEQAEQAKILTAELLTDDHELLAKDDLIGYLLIGYMEDDEYVFHYSDFPNLIK